MSQITKTSLALAMVMILCVLCLAGCGDTNPQATFDSVAAVHQSGWLNGGHSKAALEHVENCTQCHGLELQGGTSKIACIQCHLGSPSKVHPVLWGQYAYALHGSYVNQNGFEGCANANCHGTDLAGVAGSGPSCSSCHLGGSLSVHPVNWTRKFTTAPGIYPTNLPDHGAYVNANGSAACVNAVCHGSGGEGVFLSGRSCKACHV